MFQLKTQPKTHTHTAVSYRKNRHKNRSLEEQFKRNLRGNHKRMGVIFEEHACYSRHTALIMNEYGIALSPTEWVRKNLQLYLQVTNASIRPHDINTIPSIHAFCEGKPSMTCRLPSQWTNDVELWCFFDVGLSKLKNNQFAGDFRCHEAHTIISLSLMGLRCDGLSGENNNTINELDSIIFRDKVNKSFNQYVWRTILMSKHISVNEICNVYHAWHININSNFRAASEFRKCPETKHTWRGTCIYLHIIKNEFSKLWLI